ncbi:MAG: hypothetical protein IJ795_04770 [Bacteroidales bacterium]|nr:hypothetical protein [Bacteroidales bacterium]
MADYSIKEVRTGRDLRMFIEFPDHLYRNCPQYVPALHSDQKKSLTDCASARYCNHKMWLAMDGDKVVGRIHGMINPRYNDIYGTRRARFGWFDVIEDMDAAKLLLGTAEDWARENGMNEIHGPLFYNTLGKQGMLVEGFENIPVFNTYYNYPYYNDFVSALGYEKEFDWLEHKMSADQDIPEKMTRMASLLMERYGLHEGNLDDLKKDKAKVHEFFKAYNESFLGAVRNFVPFTPEEIEEEAASFMPYVSNRTSVLILDSDDNLAAFAITIPDISKALQKAGGRLFPFGWYHILKSLRNYTLMDLMINGAVPRWQNTGISAILHSKMSERYRAIGAKWALSNPQIETNIAVNVWAKYGVSELYMRRRCYVKNLGVI